MVPINVMVSLSIPVAETRVTVVEKLPRREVVEELEKKNRSKNSRHICEKSKISEVGLAEQKLRQQNKKHAQK